MTLWTFQWYVLKFKTARFRDGIATSSVCFFQNQSHSVIINIYTAVKLILLNTTYINNYGYADLTEHRVTALLAEAYRTASIRRSINLYFRQSKSSKHNAQRCHNKWSNQYFDAENFILTSNVTGHMCSRWYTEGVPVVTTDMQASIPPWHQDLCPGVGSIFVECLTRR
jgi:hypothetical protein